MMSVPRWPGKSLNGSIRIGRPRVWTSAAARMTAVVLMFRVRVETFDASYTPDAQPSGMRAGAIVLTASAV